MTEKTSKIGILKVVAKTKGIIFEGEESWINGFDEKAKEMVKTKYKGKKVEIMLNPEGKYLSMVCLEDVPDKIVEEEVVCEVSVVKNPPNPAAKILTVEEKAPPMYGFGQANELKSELISVYDRNEFQVMKKTEVETAKKGKLTYASWAEVWEKLKSLHPTSTFIVHENKETGMPYIGDEKIGYFVKVSVKVMDVTHTVHLPVMDFKNQSVKGDKLDTMAINKSIQRCFAKAIAMHGIGLYVYKGEDYPEESEEK